MRLASNRTMRRAAIGALGVVLGLAIGIVASISVPVLFGFRSYTVMSGSMTPTLRVGDVVVVGRVAPLHARVGDVVTFRDPSDSRRLITHRVRHIQARSGMVYFLTKGDANTGEERWSVPADGRIGLVKYHIPLVGYALVWVGTRFGRLAFIVIPALCLGAYELFHIWREPESGAEHEDDEEGVERHVAA